jgi:hypothetical protein
MNRWIVTLALLCGLAQPASAQKFKGDIVLTLQAGLGVAVGSFSHNYGTAPEFALQAEYAVADGTAFGVRGGYRTFGVDENTSGMGDVKIADFVLQGKHLFSPGQRTGLYAVGGWGVFWWKDSELHDLSNAEWGGLAGLGLHHEASDRVAFIAEVTYNGFFADPTGIGYFSFNIGATIGLREE